MSRTSELEKAKEWLARLKLSRTDRRTLVARFSERKSHREIAAADRIKAASSHQRQWRARQRVKAAATGTPAPTDGDDDVQASES